MRDDNATATLPSSRRAMVVRGLDATVLTGSQAGTTRVAEADVLTIGTARSNDLVLDDPTVSGFHLELRRRDDGIAVIDVGSTNGTFVGGLRIERGVVPPGTELTLGETCLRIGAGREAEVETIEGTSLGPLRGRSESMRRLMARVKRAAQSDVAVLLIGESGTGKEVIAHALHDESARARAPFVTVDCASLSPTLVASELFGHERGAFTGADRRHEGAFERARGGTLFLDEIGELPESLQPVLLGVLERRRFRRLGGRDEIETDVRVLGATHRDLRTAVNQGRFRLDLFYRLAVVTIEVPPLRERLEDLPTLVEHFARSVGYDEPIEKLLGPTVLASLMRHDWPGNVRELRNHVEATLAMGEVPALQPTGASASSAPPGARASERAPAGTMATSAAVTSGAAMASGAAMTSGETSAIDVGPALDLPYRAARAAIVQEFEIRYVKHWLARTGGNVTAAARDAKMDRSYLWDLLRRHQIR